MTERWLPVVGYEGYYEVSDQGRVRSLDRLIPWRGGTAVRWGRILNPTQLPEPDGHMQVSLSVDGRRRKAYVHRLVLEAFVGTCPEGMEGCHFPDSDPTNNRLKNLRWDTRSGNKLDRVRQGTDHNTRKTHCPRGHLLVEPNLVMSSLKHGRRDCLSCRRGRQRQGHGSRVFNPELADAHYSRIMTTSTNAAIAA